MVFGKTNAEKIKKWSEKSDRRVANSPHKRFAWVPFPLTDGRWVWLQCYWKAYSLWWHSPKYYLTEEEAKDAYSPKRRT